MVGADCRCRNLAEIGQLSLQAFDFETNDAAAGKDERHHAGRRIRFGEFDSEQIEQRILRGLIEIAAFAGKDALEAERRAATAIIRLVVACAGFGNVDGAHPIEAIECHDEAMIVRPPENIGDLDERILHMSRDDLDVIFIEGDELEFVGARTHPIASLINLLPYAISYAICDPQVSQRRRVPNGCYLQPFGVAVLPGGQPPTGWSAGLALTGAGCGGGGEGGFTAAADGAAGCGGGGGGGGFIVPADEAPGCGGGNAGFTAAFDGALGEMPLGPLPVPPGCGAGGGGGDSLTAAFDGAETDGAADA
jgi:hypothetical protein